MPKPAKKQLKRAVRTRRSKAPQPRILLGHARFLPAILIASLATLLSLQPHSMLPSSHGVLAYATNVSHTSLLASTNTQRNNNGVSTLATSSKLQTAAQAKADDMVARNYWSHNTPDGQAPWVFFTNAGYQYSSAGENLAYGFMTSNDTVTGWMNSPPHKANLLNSTFTEVGFGFANSADYVGDGQQTVVVAMYGKPLGAAAPAAPAPAAPAAPVSTPKQQPVKSTVAQPAPAPESSPATAAPLAAAAETAPQAEVITDAPVQPEQAAVTASSTSVQRIQLLASGNPYLSATAVTLAVLSAGILWITHKGFRLRKSIIAGERFVLHHIHLDLTVLAVIYLGFVLLSNSGVIR